VTLERTYLTEQEGRQMYEAPNIALKTLNFQQGNESKLEHDLKYKTENI
jgi:hypothetical protein